MLIEADRRVFPDAPPLELRFPSGDESPRELVPDDLLEPAALPVEVREQEDDPLEAFTYLGPPPSPGVTPAFTPPPDRVKRALRETAHRFTQGESWDVPTTSGRRGRASQPPSHPPQTDDHSPVTLPELDVGEPLDSGRSRHGLLGDCGVAPLLWRLVDLRADARIELRVDLDGDRRDGPLDVALEMSRGRVRATEGPVALRALEGLRRERRATEHAQDEAEAMAMIERRVGAGLLGRFEADRRLRCAREELLYDLVGATSGRFEAHPIDTSADASDRRLPFARPLPALLVEGARRRIGIARARALLGTASYVLHLPSLSHERFRAAGLEPEVVALLQRHEGMTLSSLFEAVPPDEGIGGAVWLLVQVGALHLVEGEASAMTAGDPADAVRRAVLDAAELARDGDYFAMLGVGRETLGRELRAAYVARRRELESLPLSVHGLESLEDARAEALEAVEEAWSVLQDERLRHAYLAAIEDVPAPSAALP